MGAQIAGADRKTWMPLASLPAIDHEGRRMAVLSILAPHLPSELVRLVFSYIVPGATWCSAPHWLPEGSLVSSDGTVASCVIPLDPDHRTVDPMVGIRGAHSFSDGPRQWSVVGVRQAVGIVLLRPEVRSFRPKHGYLWPYDYHSHDLLYLRFEDDGKIFMGGTAGFERGAWREHETQLTFRPDDSKTTHRGVRIVTFSVDVQAGTVRAAVNGGDLDHPVFCGVPNLGMFAPYASVCPFSPVTILSVED